MLNKCISSYVESPSTQFLDPFCFLYTCYLIVSKESPTIAIQMTHSCTFLLSPKTLTASPVSVNASLPFLSGCIQISSVSILVKQVLVFGPDSFSKEISQQHQKSAQNLGIIFESQNSSSHVSFI